MILELADLDAIDHSLTEICYGPLNLASIALFNALHFPIGHRSESEALQPLEFIYTAAEQHAYFSDDERSIIAVAHNISLVFRMSALSARSDSEQDIEIIFLAVDLGGDIYDRSFNATYMTKILAKCYKYPIIVLYRHNKTICFAGLNGCNLNQPDIVLSDWFDSSRICMQNLMSLYGLSYWNYNSRNMSDLYLDIVWLFSREYYTHPESSLQLKYGILNKEYIYSSSDDDFHPPDRVLAAEDILIAQNYYSDLYQYDFIANLGTVDIFIDTNVDEDIDRSSKVENYSDNACQDNMFSAPISILSDADIDTVIENNDFDTPLEILRYLDEHES